MLKISYNRIRKRIVKRLEERTEYLSKKDRLEIKMWRKGSEVVKFSVTYLRFYSKRWREVTRWDNAHSKKSKAQLLRKPHHHIFSLDNGQLYVTPIKGKPAEILTEAITNIKLRRKEILHNFFNNKKI